MNRTRSVCSIASVMMLSALLVISPIAGAIAQPRRSGPPPSPPRVITPHRAPSSRPVTTTVTPRPRSTSTSMGRPGSTMPKVPVSRASGSTRSNNSTSGSKPSVRSRSIVARFNYPSSSHVSESKRLTRLVLKPYGIKRSDIAKHHVIPLKFIRHEAIRRSTFNIRGGHNALILPTSKQAAKGALARRIVHQSGKYHPVYTKAIGKRLDKIAQEGREKNWKPAQYDAAIRKVLNDTKGGLKNGRGRTLK